MNTFGIKTDRDTTNNTSIARPDYSQVKTTGQTSILDFKNNMVLETDTKRW